MSSFDSIELCESSSIVKDISPSCRLRLAKVED